MADPLQRYGSMVESSLPERDDSLLGQYAPPGHGRRGAGKGSVQDILEQQSRLSVLDSLSRLLSPRYEQFRADADYAQRHGELPDRGFRGNLERGLSVAPFLPGGSAAPRGAPPVAAPAVRPPAPPWPLPGQPSHLNIPGHGRVEARPLPQVEQARHDYARSRGQDYYPVTEFAPFDEARARRIAQAFDDMRHDPTNPEAIRAYEALMEETAGQYDALRRAGVQIEFNPPGADPYARSPALGYIDMRDNNRLFVFPTLEGFGSGAGLSREAIANNPLLRDSGFQISGRPATYNDLFRAVHDVFGHNGPGNPFFRHQGEERAFRHHSRMYSPTAGRAAGTELTGQNNWLNFGPFGERNRTASAADTIYADQKINVLPDWVFEELSFLGQNPRRRRRRGGRVARQDGGANPLSQYMPSWMVTPLPTNQKPTSSAVQSLMRQLSGTLPQQPHDDGTMGGGGGPDSGIDGTW